MAIEFNAGDNAPVNEKAFNSYESLCTICGRKLGSNPFYFEVNTNWTIIELNSDEKNSQGCFPLGNECAKKFAPNLLTKFGA